ncbi:Cell division protein ZapD [Burkholderiales bacterium]|nr:MAG: cell division protein ZapD [Burkholderiales bacterium]CAG1007751.1 Cell division protein ZapD [Burkholderiales bacterium]
MIRYEFPLNERVRTLMRLEDIFRRAQHFIACEHALDHHVALLSLFEIIDVAARADLKSDLLQELERQRQMFIGWRSNPSIVQDTLEEVITQVETAAAALLAVQGKLGQHMRASEWLMSVKQRTGIPGGVCEFDLPSYHFWLNLPAETRRSDLRSWLDPMLPVEGGLAILLRLMRDSGKTVAHTAHNGVFQLMMTATRAAQLLRVGVAEDRPCVPEVSANKYALNVRFLEPTRGERPRVIEANVEFELAFCNL